MGYVIGDCSLANDMRLEIPSNYTAGDLIVKDGKLFNTTSSTITVYSDQFPEYSFRLSPMSGLSWRENNYSYVDVPFTVDSGPFLYPASTHVMIFCSILIAAFLIICKGGAKRG